MDRQSQNIGLHWIFAWYLFALAVFLLPLISHAFIGSYTRYHADDYCKAALAREYGVWGAAEELYNTMEGLYSHNVFTALVSTAGLWIVRVLPTVVIILWLAGLTLLIKQLLAIFHNNSSWLISFFLAAVLLYATLGLTPNFFQNIYWQTGIGKYTLAIITGIFLLAIGLYILANQPSSRSEKLWFIVGALIAFVSAGFSETYLTVQLSALIIALLAGALLLQGNRRHLFLAYVFGSIIGTAVSAGIILLAPGKEVRQATTNPQIYTELPALFVAVLNYSSQFINYFVRKSPLILFTTTLVVVLVVATTKGGITLVKVSRWQRILATAAILGGFLLIIIILSADALGFGGPPGLGTRQLMLLVLAMLMVFIAFLWRFSLLKFEEILSLMGLGGAVFILVAASFTPATYALSHAGPGRAHLIPTFILVILVGIGGYFVGIALKRIQLSLFPSISEKHFFIVLSILIFPLLFIGPLHSTYQILQSVPSVREFALAWDAEDAAIRAERDLGLIDQVVSTFGYNGHLDEITDDPKFWVNRCVADYYNLNSVVIGTQAEKDFDIEENWLHSGWSQ